MRGPQMAKHILVTGANTGIGLALCKILVVEHQCYVYLGCRSVERGRAGLKSIVDAHPEAAASIELLQIDVADAASCGAAAEALRAKGVVLSGLVNNAGVGLVTAPDSLDMLLSTNFLGPRRVTDAFVELLDPACGRIVNVSSGSASMWLRNQVRAPPTPGPPPPPLPALPAKWHAHAVPPCQPLSDHRAARVRDSRRRHRRCSPTKTSRSPSWTPRCRRPPRARAPGAWAGTGCQSAR